MIKIHTHKKNCYLSTKHSE